MVYGKDAGGRRDIKINIKNSDSKLTHPEGIMMMHSSQEITRKSD